MIETRQKTIQVGIRQRSLRKHCRLGRATELVFILATGVMLTLAGQAGAQTWDGSDSNDYLTAGNWDDNAVPDGADDVIIDGPPNPVPNPALAGAASANSITVTNKGLELNPGANLNVATNLTIGTGGILAMQSGSTLSGAAALIVDGGSAFVRGNLANVTVEDGGSFRADSNITITNLTLSGNTTAQTTLNSVSGTTLNVTGGALTLGATDGQLLTFGGGGGTVVLNPTTFTAGGEIAATLASGTLRLSANTAGLLSDGSTTFDGGTLDMNGQSVTIDSASGASGTITNTGGGAVTLTLEGTGTTGASVVNGTGTTSVVLNDSAGLDVGAGSTYTGSTTVNDTATLNLNTGANLSDSAALTVTGGTVTMNADDTIGSFSMSGGELGGSETLTVTGAKTLDGGTIAATLGGAGATTVQTGITTVTGTIDGDVTVAGTGTLRIESATAVAGTITTTGSVVSLGDGQNEGSALNISGPTTQIEVLASEAAEYSGTISSTGANGFEKIGTGTLTVSGTNDYTGATVVSAGTLVATNSAALGTTAVGTTVADGATLALSGGITTSEAITLNGTGVGGNGALLNASGANTLSGQIALGSAATIANADTDFVDQLIITGGITGTDTNLTFAGDGSFDVNSAITTGAGTLTKNGSGVVFLQGINTFSGATTINDGSINVNSGSALSDAALVTINAPGVLAVQTSETVGNIAGDGQINLFAGATLTAGDATPTSTFSGIITDNNPGDAGSFTKAGTGTLTLSGANDYTGATTVSAGTLNVSGSIASAVVSIAASATLEVDGTSLGDTAAVTVDGTLALSGSETIGTLEGAASGVVDLDANTLTIGGNATPGAQTTTFGGDIQGSGGLVKSGDDILVLSGTNSFTGDATITGGTLRVTGGTALATAVDVIVGAGGTFDVAATEVIGSLATTPVGPTPIPSASVTIASGQALEIGGSTDTTFAGNISGAGNLVNLGGGTLTLTGANALTGGLQAFGAGSEVALTGAGTIASANISAINGGTITTDGGAITNAAAAVAIDGGGVFTISGSETVGRVIDNAFGPTDGTININGAGTVLTLNGTSGTSQIGGAVTGTGTLNVTGGTTTVASGGTITTAGLTVAGGTVNLNGTGSVDTTGNAITVSSGALVNDGDGIADGDAVTVSGTGTLTTNGTDTIAALTQNGGTVNGSALLTAGAYTQNGGDMAGLLAATAGSALNGGTISGTLSGGTATAATGTTNVTGSITATGLTVSGGTVNLNGAGNVNAGAGGITVSSGALVNDGDGIADNDAVTVSGTGTLTTNGTDTILSLDQTGGTVDGTGQLTANTYTQSGGDMAGLLSATSGSALNGGTISGTLSGDTAAVQGPTATTVTGTISADTDITGTLNVDGGNLSGINILNGGTIAGLSDSTITGLVATLAGGGTITAASGTTLTLSSLNPTAGGLLTIGATGQTGTVQVNSSVTQSSASTVDIDAGTLLIGGANAGINLLDFIAGTTIATGATLDIGGFDTAVNALSGAGTVTNSGAAAGLTLAGTSTFDGVIQNGTGAVDLTVTALNGVNADVTLTGNNTFSGGTTVQGAGAQTASLTLEGAGSNLSSTSLVTVNTGGTLVIDGNETIGSLNGTGTGTVDIDNGTLTLDAASGSYAGAITGAGDLVKNGTGTLTLSGGIANGTVTVNEGTLVLSGTNTMSQITVAGATPGAATLRLESNAAAGGGTGLIRTTGSIIDYANSVNIGTTIEIASDTTQVQVTTGSATQSGAIGQDVAGRPLEKIGAGELILSGTNTFTGDMTITGGTLTLVGSSALNDAVDVIVETGATLNVDDSEDIASLAASAADAALTFDSNTTLDIVGAVDTDYAGTMTDDGSAILVNSGSGTLTLSGDGSGFSGTIGSVGTGTIALTGTTNASVVGSDVGATLSAAGGTLLASNVILVADGQVNINGSETVGAVTNAVPSGNAIGTITISGAATVLTVNGSANPQNPGNFNGIDGTIDGDGTLSITGGSFNVGATGDVQVETSVVAGGTLVNDGTMAGVGNAGTFANTAGATAGAVTNSGSATIEGTIASLTNTAGDTTVQGGGIVTGNTSVSDGSITLNGSDLDDASTVTVSGTGTLTVLAADTVGALTQTGGTIDGDTTLTVAGLFDQTGGATDQTVTVNAGSFSQDGGTIGSGTTVSVEGPGTKTLNGGTINGTLTGTGLVTVQTGTTLLNGTISDGETTIAATGVLELTGDSLVTSLDFEGGELTASADATLTGSAVGVRDVGQSGTISAANGVTLTLASTFFVRGAGLPVGAEDTTTTFGSVGNDGTVVIATTGLGRVGNNASVVIAEGTVVVGSTEAGESAFSNSVFLATGVTTTVDATLDINGFETSVSNLAGDGDIVNEGADALLILETDQDSTFDGVIADGAGVISVQKVQGGTQILTADQAYTGTTTVTAGTLQAGDGGTTGTFGAGDIIVNAPGTATLNRSDDITVTNLIIGNGTVVHAGTGTTTLTATNTVGSQFTGTANIDAGTVQLDGLLGDSVGNTATMNVNSGGTLQGTGTFAGTVNVLAGGTIAAGASPGTFNVGGNLVLAGTSEFELGDADVFGGNGPTNDLINVTGNLTLGGALEIVDNGSLGTGYYRLFNYGGTQSGSFASVSNPLGGTTATVLTNVGGQVNLRVSDGSVAVQFWDGTDFFGNSAIDGGTDTWNATNTNWTNANGSFNDGWLSGEGVFQGTAGTVTVAGAQSFQALIFDVAGYTLEGTGTLVSPTAGGFSILEANADATINAEISGAGGINKTGTGILTLGAVNTYLGTTDVAEGTLRLAVDNALPTGTDVTVFDSATLDLDGTEQEIGDLSGQALATVDLGAGGRLVVAGGGDTVFAGNIAGDDDSRFDFFNGTIELTGASTMTGTMAAFGGTLELAAGATTAATRVGSINDGQFVTAGGALVNNAVVFTAAADSVVRFDGSETVGFLGAGSSGLGQTAGLGTIDLAGAGVVLTLTGAANAAYGSTFSEHAGLITGDGALTVSGGTHRLSGTVANDYQGVTTVSGGTLELAGGVAIRNAGVVDLTGTGTLRVIDEEVIGSLSGTAGTFLVLDDRLTTGGTDASTEMAGIISGAGDLRKLGTGTFTLSGTNTYQGQTRVNSGTLRVTNDAGLGSTASGTLVVAGATLQLDGGRTIGAEALTLNGTGVASGGALRSTGGANALAGAVTLGSATQITTATASDTLTLSGPVDTAGFLLTVTGPGDTTLGGVVSGAGGLTKQDAGVLTISGASTYAGATTISDGEVEVTATGAMSGTASVAVNGDSLLTNAGTINTAATTTVEDDATFNNSGTAGAVTNEGTFDNSGTAGATDNSGGATNSGTLASLVNTGDFTSNAGTVTGLATNNDGTSFTINSGNFTGGLDNTAGLVTAQGTMTGNVTNSGTFTTAGALTAGTGTFTNEAGAILNVTSAYTGLGLVTNDGTINLTGSTLGTAATTSLTNNATVNVLGTATLAGGLGGSGVVDLGADDGVDNTLTLGGLAGSVGAHTFILGYDVDGTGDGLISGGGTAFSAALQTFNITLQDNFALGTTATVVQGQAGLTSALNIQDDDGNNLNTGGALLYSITDVGGNTLLAVEANPAVGGIASGVSLTQSLVANVVNRPSSPFASGLASEIGCSQGGYGRAVGGRAEAKGSSFAGVVDRENSLTATYFGVQAGYDFICNDGRFFDGWNGGAGVLLGYNNGSTDQPVLLDLGGGTPTLTSITNSDFDQTYAGFYVVGNKEGLTVDAQVRFENTDYELSETAIGGFDGLGLANDTFSTRSTNLTGRVSYNIPINEEGLNFVPTAGFSITRTGDATLTFSENGNTLDLDSYTSKVGFIGGTLAKTRINEEAASGSTLFVSGNYYHEFGGDRTATFTAAGTSTPITSDNLGGFGELSFGWNYIKVLDAGSAGARQVNTNLRLDTRFGSNISNSYSLTAQVRLSF